MMNPFCFVLAWTWAAWLIASAAGQTAAGQTGHGSAVPRDDGPDLSARTIYIYTNCSESETQTIKQSMLDATILARHAVIIPDRELRPHADNPHAPFIDFTSPEAIDFFGPPDYQPSSKERIITTFVRATGAEDYGSWGWSDWWWNRYIEVFCHAVAPCDEPTKGQDPVMAWIKMDKGNGFHLMYPQITYCPGFFTLLRPHGDLVAEIWKDTTGEMMKNTKNLRSQALTTLHEWTHIWSLYPSMISGLEKGTDDVWVTFAEGLKMKSYKAGRAKMLARMDPGLAAKNADNYVYFAVTRFMKDIWKDKADKPEEVGRYPTAWDPQKTVGENSRLEKLQPGNKGRTWGGDDEDDEDEDLLPDVPVSGPLPSDYPPVPISLYPSWYQPVLTATGTTVPPIAQYTPVIIPPAIQPDPGAVFSCIGANKTAQNTAGNAAEDIEGAFFRDCVEAFEPTFVVDGNWTSYPEAPVSFGPTTVVQLAYGTCGIALSYDGILGIDCPATKGDVWAHARWVLEACTNFDSGTVSGSVPFNVPNCTADVIIFRYKSGL